MKCLGLFLPFHGRVRQNLHIDAVNLVASEASCQELGLDLGVEFVVDYIGEHMVHGVVKVKMLERVDIKVHLVVLAQAVVVYSQK